MNTKEKAEVELLKQRLLICEKEIIRIGKPYNNHCQIDDWDRLFYLLKERAAFLNRMFHLHATEKELQRFHEVNNRLAQLTEDFHQRHMQLYQYVSRIQTRNGGSFGWQTDIGPDTSFDDKNTLLEMDEDEFYGSHWEEMIWIIGKHVKNIGLICNDKHLDGPRMLPDVIQLNETNVCKLFFSLCTFLRYSIPDVLRIQHYHYCYYIDTGAEEDIVPIII